MSGWAHFFAGVIVGVILSLGILSVEVNIADCDRQVKATEESMDTIHRLELDAVNRRLDAILKINTEVK